MATAAQLRLPEGQDATVDFDPIWLGRAPYDLTSVTLVAYVKPSEAVDDDDPSVAVITETAGPNGVITVTDAAGGLATLTIDGSRDPRAGRPSSGTLMPPTARARPGPSRTGPCTWKPPAENWGARVVVDSSILSTVLASAGSGTAIIVVLILSGILRTGQEVKRIEKDADNWKAAYEGERGARETERKANDELRAAAMVQAQRADAAVETAKLATALLEDLRRKRIIDAPPA